MNMEKLEQIIKNTRNVLREEGITGMDSITHCLIFVLIRSLNKESCKKLKLSDDLAFDKLLIDENGDEIESQELYEKIYSKNNKECIIYKFVTQLNMSSMRDFKVKNPNNVLKIMKLFKDFEIDSLNNKCDIVGSIYEMHLKTGSSHAMRDLGQFFTNRQVIKYMVNLCDPQVINGKIETICDPTMGTAGFLTMSVKYLNDKFKDINWSKNKKYIYGFDIDENVKNMARLNMYLETGEMFDNFSQIDTLQNDLRITDPNNTFTVDKVKIILANEPMGLKNITHASCCDKIKDLKIRGTKAEPLFLQLFMQSLENNGRCAVIVPDGVLFNNSNLHKDTRKYLIDNFNLKKIVSMNDDFFMNTGVKTSILFFTKEDNKTKNIKFCEIKLKDNEIDETLIQKVSIKEIKNKDYILNPNTYLEDPIKQIENIEYKKLGEICEVNFGQRIIKNETESKEEDKIKYPCYGGGGISFYTKEYNREGLNVIISRFGVSHECVRIITGKIWLNDSGLTVYPKNDKEVSHKYMCYYILSISNSIYKLCVGACQKNLNVKEFTNIPIPLPSLQTQNEIVKRLDVLYDNKKILTDIVKGCKTRMSYYLDVQCVGEMKKLGTILTREHNGKTNSTEITNTGEYPFYSASSKNPSGTHSKYDFTGKEYFLFAKSGGNNKTKIGESLGIGKFWFVSGKSAGNVAIIKFIVSDTNICINKYIHYYLNSILTEIQNLTVYTTGNGNIPMDKLMETIIPIPPIEKQKEIVEYCDSINSYIESSEKQITNIDNEIKLTMNKYLSQPNIKDEQVKKNDEIDEKYEKLSDSVKSIHEKVKKV